MERLNKTEMHDLASMVKKGRSLWRFVYDTNGKPIRNCGVWLEDGQMVRTEASTSHTPEEIARGVYEALKGRRDRRREGAKRAAVTHAQRKEKLVYAWVRRYLQTGALPPAPRCRFCGRKLSDADSRSRGIGSECWQGFLTVLEAERGSM